MVMLSPKSGYVYEVPMVEDLQSTGYDRGIEMELNSGRGYTSGKH